MGISGAGSVTIISARAGAMGRLIPSCSISIPPCGPAAITSTSQPNSPRGVFTLVTRPPVVPNPVTGACCRMRPP